MFLNKDSKRTQNKRNSLPSDIFVSNCVVRHSIRCDECIFIAVRHDFVDESHHSDAVAPRVLEVDAGQPVCREDQTVNQIIWNIFFLSRFILAYKVFTQRSAMIFEARLFGGQNHKHNFFKKSQTRSRAYLNDLSNHLLVTSGPQTRFLTVSVEVSSLWIHSSRQIVNRAESTTDNLVKNDGILDTKNW